LIVAVGAERIPLDREECYLGPQTMEIRPPRSSVIGPSLVLLAGVGMVVPLAFFMDRLPAAGAGALLLAAIPALTFGTLATIYSLVGARVVVEAEKRSVRFQQGIMGLGLGTQELIPFWKIQHIELADCDIGVGRGPAFPFEMRAWEVVLVKTSGKRLPVAQVTVPQAEGVLEEGFQRAYRVAQALAHLSGRPLVITAALEETEEEQDRVGKEAI